MARSKLRSELGKGIEALRSAQVVMMDNLAGSATYDAIIGPFETDIEVSQITITPGIKPATDNGNTLDVFNGTVAGAKPIITQLDNTALQALTNQVPSKPALIAGSTRVPAGTPITVRFVASGSNASAPSTVTVRIGYDIPYWDPNAVYTTYGAYDDGI